MSIKDFDTVLFENDDFVLKYNGQGVVLVDILAKFISTDVIKKQEEESVFAVKKTKCRKVLTDLSKINLMAQDARQYAMDALRGRIIELRLTHQAVVVPKEIFSKWDVNMIADSLKDQAAFNVRMFFDFDSAYEWLMSQ